MRNGVARARAGATILILAILTVAAASAVAKGPGGSGGSCGVNTEYLCVQGGTTKFTFSASWLAPLRSAGWRLKAIPPAKKRGNRLLLPIVKSGKLTLFRRSRIAGLSEKVPGGECLTDGALTVKESIIHHAGGFALLRGGVRRPFDALALKGNAFYWRGSDHSEQGEKGPGSGTIGGVWSGSPRIDAMVSASEGRTIANQLRLIEEGPLPRLALGVMGKADSFWRIDPYCQVAPAEPKQPPEEVGFSG